VQFVGTVTTSAGRLQRFVVEVKADYGVIVPATSDKMEPVLLELLDRYRPIEPEAI